MYLHKSIEINWLVGSRLDFVLAYPFGPVVIVHNHEQAANSPKGNLDGQHNPYNVYNIILLLIISKPKMRKPKSTIHVLAWRNVKNWVGYLPQTYK